MAIGSARKWRFLDADAAKADAGDAHATDRAALIAIFGTMGGIAASLALFVVSGALGLAIAQRRRETAVLRALGASPSQVRRLIAAESLIVSLVAGALGILLGGPLASAIAGSVVDHGVAPPTFEPAHSWIPLVAAMAWESRSLSSPSSRPPTAQGASRPRTPCARSPSSTPSRACCEF